jgi:N12 class adenine-specific DNA methylase
MAALRDMIGTANEQFNGWCKANASIIDRLSESANDPSRLYFRQVDDESQLSIPGMSGNVTPHGYQNSFIRRMGRNFSGINGFGVGLGKTLTALASVAHVQSIGAKKKTAFVVPNSVLSNWRKEAANVYSSMEDCLFVGLTVNEKTGKAKVESSDYDRDLNAIRENQAGGTLEMFRTGS